VTWDDDATGIAVRGARLRNVLFGIMAPYVKLHVRIDAGEVGRRLVRIEPLALGWGGGAIGLARTRGSLKSLGAELEQTFR
jgi:hypothetical protein